MKSFFVVSGLVLSSLFGFSENTSESNKNGEFYFYWGWNRAHYSKSDINFIGDNYNFTLKKVSANDRPTKFSVNTYFTRQRFTVPQYNYRLGYFFNNKYNISVGMDHMKYVVPQEQTVKILGDIANSPTIYNGTYNNEDIVIKDNLLIYEHTDGLNYINTAIRRLDEIALSKKISLGITEGIGVGVLLPKAQVLSSPNYDQFHLSGYGINSSLALQVSFYKSFFIQSEFKAGFINMPHVRTTANKSEKASQHFFFRQFNVVFGMTLNLKKTQNKVDED